MAAWVKAVTPTRIGFPCIILAFIRERSVVARKWVFPGSGRSPDKRQAIGEHLTKRPGLARCEPATTMGEGFCIGYNLIRLSDWGGKPLRVPQEPYERVFGLRIQG